MIYKLLIGVVLSIAAVMSLDIKKEFPVEFAPASLEDVQLAEAQGYTCDHQYGIYNCLK